MKSDSFYILYIYVSTRWKDAKMTPGLQYMNMFNMNGNMFGMGSMSTMFGQNMFGFGGCSLFTNCDGTYNYDAMAGFAVGGALMNVAGQAISYIIQENKANSKESFITQANNIDKEIDKLVDKLGCSSESEALSYTVEQDDAGKKVTELNTKLTDKQNELNALPTKEACEADIKAYNDALNQDPAPDANTLAQLKAKKEAAEENIKKRDTLEAEISKLKDTEIPAAEKKKAARQKEIQNIQDEIRDLIDECNDLDAKINEKTLDKADGGKLQRTSKEDFEAKFTETKDSTGKNVKKFDAAKEVKKGDIRYAIQGYRTASTSEEKQEWAHLFNELWANMDASDRTTDFRAARKLIPTGV